MGITKPQQQPQPVAERLFTALVRPRLVENDPAVRAVQQMLNKKGANLDIDGVMGPLTKKSINKYLPKAATGKAPEPDKKTAVQRSQDTLKEGIPKNAAEKKLFELLQAWSMFISFKTAKIKDHGVDQAATNELIDMFRTYQGPVLNGMKWTEMTKGDLWQNPKVIPHLLKYIYQAIPYVEERIKKYVRPNDQGQYLDYIDTYLKPAYKEVVSLYSNPSIKERMMPASNFAGTPKNKLGPAAHLKGKMKRPARAGDLVGDAQEGYYPKDDHISYHGRMPRIDKIPQDSTAAQAQQQAMVDRMKQQTIDTILDIEPEWGRSDLELMTAAELNQILRDLQAEKARQGVSEGNKKLTWSNLGSGMSMADKIEIFEKYHTSGNLLESNDRDAKVYFQSLYKLSDHPVKNKTYIVVPAAMINNKIRLLNQPEYLEFLGISDDTMTFTKDGRSVEYPNDIIRDLGIYNTFVFSDTSSYDKFRSALNLKFDLPLPTIKPPMKDSKHVPLSEDVSRLYGNLLGQILLREISGK